jgi:hypothetical protein
VTDGNERKAEKQVNHLKDGNSDTAAISKIDLPTFGFWCLSVVPTDSQPTFNLHANTNSF